MRRVIALAILLTATSAAFAQSAPTPADQQQAQAATLADLSSMIVSLRAQLIADQRRIAELEKQIAEKKPEEKKP